MNEEIFTQDMRKFLKKVGVTSQQEIEKAVQQALEANRLYPDAELSAHVTLRVEGPDGALLVDHGVDGSIRLEDGEA
ncbi:DUF6494 family protein [Thiohalorhabdus sp. Cl-TMA]|uniref:DUF6494 family protein n=1 Tax=Thiohalorhabdus methylotrophus TaxID=3242694 RepID=A0ABV4TTX1_9GAMM